ncbi:hypothetical protein HY379_00620, partial [Candidatus Saccharibacteria bacterium]|nr:hypothetical protein [Candidatus Saccharibacteria bacterium]
MEFIGLTAGLLTLSTYIPQALKTLRTRRTVDLSLGTLIMLSSSALLWAVYGIGKHLPAVWLTNIVILGLGLI